MSSLSKTRAKKRAKSSAAARVRGSKSTTPPGTKPPKRKGSGEIITRQRKRHSEQRRAKQLTAEQKGARAKMLAKLKDSALDADDARALSYEPFTDDESVTLGLSRKGAGFRLPYRTADVTPLPMYRYRYFDVPVCPFTKKELRKYDQPRGSDPEIYLPHLSGVDWPKIMGDTSQPLIITEGELKAASGTKHIMPTIGLGGVWNFSRKARHQELLPTLEAFTWLGRTVYIVYDSDAVMKKEVMTAENRLARILTDLGAFVKVPRIPPKKGRKKYAMDDMIAEEGAEKFIALLDETHEWVASKALHELNEEVVYVRHPSMVVEHPKDDQPEDQERYRAMKVATFVKETYANRKYYVETSNGRKQTSTAADWIKWEARAEVDSITYAPGQPPILNDNQLNTWPGWGVEPKAGDVSLFLKLFNHLTEGMKPEHRKWLLQWLAYPIQRPGAKMNTAVVMWSVEKGVGKSLLGFTMRELYGKANFCDVSRTDLEGAFNSWQRYRQFVMGEEITGEDPKDVKAFADKLKHIITRTEVTINNKYQPHYRIPDTINYYFTSNHSDCFQIDDHERRYFVHEIESKKLPDEFFREYDAWYKSEDGAAALFHYFLHDVDTSDFNPQAAAPATASKEEMVDMTLNAAGRLVRDLGNNLDGSYFGRAFADATSSH